MVWLGAPPTLEANAQQPLDGGLNLQEVADALPIIVSLSEFSSVDGIHRANLVVGASRSAM